MESQPHNTEFRINPENFHPCKYLQTTKTKMQNYPACRVKKVQNFKNPELLKFAVRL